MKYEWRDAMEHNVFRPCLILYFFLCFKTQYIKSYLYINKAMSQNYSQNNLFIEAHSCVTFYEQKTRSSIIDQLFSFQINWFRNSEISADRLTIASIFVTRVTKGSKLRISTTEWGRRSKIALKVHRESFGAIKILEYENLNIR